MPQTIPCAASEQLPHPTNVALNLIHLLVILAIFEASFYATMVILTTLGRNIYALKIMVYMGKGDVLKNSQNSGIEKT